MPCGRQVLHLELEPKLSFITFHRVSSVLTSVVTSREANLSKGYISKGHFVSPLVLKYETFPECRFCFIFPSLVRCLAF